MLESEAQMGALNEASKAGPGRLHRPPETTERPLPQAQPAQPAQAAATARVPSGCDYASWLVKMGLVFIHFFYISKDNSYNNSTHSYYPNPHPVLTHSHK